MNKLPVGETVRIAYRFTMRELGTIIGLIWIPMVAVAVINFLPYALGDNLQSPDVNAAAASAAALRGIVFWLISVLLSACIYVPVTRQALGLRTGPAFAHIAFGRAEFRLWGAYLIFVVILFVLMLGLILAALVAAFAANATGSKPLVGAVVSLVVLVGLCGLIYAMTRLVFLLAPVVVVEDKISFERAWSLTAGNFWRIVGVLFLVTLLPAIVFLGAFASLLGPDIVGLYHQAVAEHMNQQAIADRMQAIVDTHISLMLGIQLIIAPFSVGLTCAASAHAYKVLTGKALTAPIPQPGAFS
jgi:hypothetical protein